MKQIQKVRKTWLIDPETKVHELKKNKRRFESKQNKKLRNYIGVIDPDELDELDDDLDDV